MNSLLRLTNTLSRNVTALDSTSRVYFLEESEDLRYKVIFGDGVLGRKLIDNEFVVLTYIATDGPAANGATKFNFIGRAIDNTNRPILPSSMSLATIDGSQSGRREGICPIYQVSCSKGVLDPKQSSY